jgi:hypothetical protein
MIAVPFGVLAMIVLIPIICAMMVAGTCASYRFQRYLAYRALRRHGYFFAFPLSYSVGLRVFIARIRQDHRRPNPRILDPP